MDALAALLPPLVVAAAFVAVARAVLRATDGSRVPQRAEAVAEVRVDDERIPQRAKAVAEGHGDDERATDADQETGNSAGDFGVDEGD